MTAIRATPPSPSISSPSVPLLQNGDRLTRVEFERRYRAMPQVKKAELIEGIVYMPSPVRILHAQPHATLITWLGYYVSKTPGLILADNGTVRLDEDNEPQPDVMLLIPEWAGGSVNIDDDNYVSGAPELAGEIAASSVSLDMHAKLNAYRRNGVREYLVWRTEEAALDWFVLREGLYAPLASDAEGVIRSEIFPGLALDSAALLRGDLPRLFQVIDTHVQNEAHAAFVKRLSIQA